jgi:hypothetical protein
MCAPDVFCTIFVLSFFVIAHFYSFLFCSVLLRHILLEWCVCFGSSCAIRDGLDYWMQLQLGCISIPVMH